jgi:hypothetical protein
MPRAEPEIVVHDEEGGEPCAKRAMIRHRDLAITDAGDGASPPAVVVNLVVVTLSGREIVVVPASPAWTAADVAVAARPALPKGQWVNALAFASGAVFGIDQTVGELGLTDWCQLTACVAEAPSRSDLSSHSAEIHESILERHRMSLDRAAWAEHSTRILVDLINEEIAEARPGHPDRSVVHRLKLLQALLCVERHNPISPFTRSTLAVASAAIRGLQRYPDCEVCQEARALWCWKYQSEASYLYGEV